MGELTRLPVRMTVANIKKSNYHIVCNALGGQISGEESFIEWSLTYKSESRKLGSRQNQIRPDDSLGRRHKSPERIHKRSNSVSPNITISVGGDTSEQRPTPFQTSLTALQLRQHSSLTNPQRASANPPLRELYSNPYPLSSPRSSLILKRLLHYTSSY